MELKSSLGVERLETREKLVGGWELGVTVE